jgi:acetyltransferase
VKTLVPGRKVLISATESTFYLSRKVTVLVTLNLDRIFNPKSVAVIGASDEEGSVGYALMKNFVEMGFEGKIFPVNLRKAQILGLKAYPTIENIAEPVDLAVIAILRKPFQMCLSSVERLE